MLEESSFESADAQVEELCLLVFALSNEWIERMNQTSDASLRCFTLSPPELFKRGIHSLQALFSGALPESFLEVFALLLVACAISYGLHQDDEYYDWKAFFADGFQWQHALKSASERNSLKQALECLACCDGFQKGSTIDSPGYIANQASCHARSRLHWWPKPETSHATERGHRYKLCETRISERNSALLPGHFLWYGRQKESTIQDLVDRLIRPLQSAKGIEALFDIILDAEFQIHMGLLRDPREVEVALFYAGKLYSKTSQFYERFKAVVSLYCDWAMQQGSPSWRDPYYVTHLDNIMAIALEIETRQQTILDMPAVNCWPNASVLEITHQKSPMTASSRISSASQRHYQSSISTPLTAASGSTTLSSIFSTCDSAGTTSTRMSQASSTSSRVTVLPISDDGMSKCPECSATFTGSFSNRRSNLRRHMRTSLKHSGKEGHKCPEQALNLAESLGPPKEEEVQTASSNEKTYGSPIFLAAHGCMVKFGASRHSKE